MIRITSQAVSRLTNHEPWPTTENARILFGIAIFRAFEQIHGKDELWKATLLAGTIQDPDLNSWFQFYSRYAGASAKEIRELKAKARLELAG